MSKKTTNIDPADWTVVRSKLWQDAEKYTGDKIVFTLIAVVSIIMSTKGFGTPGAAISTLIACGVIVAYHFKWQRERRQAVNDLVTAVNDVVATETDGVRLTHVEIADLVDLSSVATEEVVVTSKVKTGSVDLVIKTIDEDADHRIHIDEARRYQRTAATDVAFARMSR